MKTQTTTVTTTAQVLNPTPGTPGLSGQGIGVQNNGAVTAYLGGSDVTTANGWPLAPGATLPLGGSQVSTLWAVTASGTTTVALCVA